LNQGEAGFFANIRCCLAAALTEYRQRVGALPPLKVS
jgi:hypothetical protein